MGCMVILTPTNLANFPPKSEIVSTDLESGIIIIIGRRKSIMAFWHARLVASNVIILYVVAKNGEC